jgi:hypothetical protein
LHKLALFDSLINQNLNQSCINLHFSENKSKIPTHPTSQSTPLLQFVQKLVSGVPTGDPEYPPVELPVAQLDSNWRQLGQKLQKSDFAVNFVE